MGPLQTLSSTIAWVCSDCQKQRQQLRLESVACKKNWAEDLVFQTTWTKRENGIRIWDPSGPNSEIQNSSSSSQMRNSEFQFGLEGLNFGPRSPKFGLEGPSFGPGDPKFGSEGPNSDPPPGPNLEIRRRGLQVRISDLQVRSSDIQARLGGPSFEPRGPNLKL